MNRDIKVPKKITPCPIIEALLEIRFKPSVPAEAILGYIHPILKQDFPGKIENLPIQSLPGPIRLTDPNFKFAPWYRIQKDNFIVQIGPRVISFSSVNNYIGWDAFFPRISDYFNAINAAKVFDSFERIGLRYINFFNLNIYDKSTIGLHINNNPFASIDSNIRTTIQLEKLRTIIMVANNANATLNNKVVFGSILDIDTFYEGAISHDQLLAMTNEAHSEEKIIFYNLLKPDFISTLNPEY